MNSFCTLNIMAFITSILCRALIIFYCSSIAQAGGVDFQSLAEDGINIGEGVASEFVPMNGLNELTGILDTTGYSDDLKGLPLATGAAEVFSKFGGLDSIKSHFAELPSEISSILGANVGHLTDGSVITDLSSALTKYSGMTSEVAGLTTLANLDLSVSEFNSLTSVESGLPDVAFSGLSTRLAELRSALSELAKLSAFANLQSAVSEYEGQSHTFSQTLTQALTEATQAGETMQSLSFASVKDTPAGSVYSSGTIDATDDSSTYSTSYRYTVPPMGYKIGDPGAVITIDGHIYTLGTVISGGQIVHGGGGITSLETSIE